ncbi:MAG TPA: hypothetical protein DD381_14035 [Lentisphaeria bacterium]|nr:MAG: hypothetical protein A2X47_01230 [Lentisphaerae bacterium GWF2_38_69]HBM17443.1 hypothetical protein [Lentisphaeria bacterium]
MHETKRKILTAAAHEFALNGYNGATIRDICRRAGVNLASINYHFKSKESLYKEMFEFLFCETEKENVFDKESYESFSEWRYVLRKWVENIILDIIQKNPLSEAKWKIFGWEIQDPSSIFPSICETFLKPRLSILASHFRKVLPDDTSEDDIYIRVFSVISICVFYFRDREIIKTVFPGRNFVSEQIEKIIKNITDVACMGISYQNEENIKR